MFLDLVEQEFIPFKEALQLKELGFNEACIAFFNGGYHDGGYHDWMIDSSGTGYPTINVNMHIGTCVIRPTFSQVFRWFREKHKLTGYVTVDFNHHETAYYWKVIDERQKKQYVGSSHIEHREAELGLLEKLIELIKNK